MPSIGVRSNVIEVIQTAGRAKEQLSLRRKEVNTERASKD